MSIDFRLMNSRLSLLDFLQNQCSDYFADVVVNDQDPTAVVVQCVGKSTWEKLSSRVFLEFTIGTTENSSISYATLKRLRVCLEGDTDIVWKTIKDTGSTDDNYRLQYISKCSSGILIHFSALTLQTWARDSGTYCCDIVITLNNNGDTTSIIGTSTNAARDAGMRQPYCYSEGDDPSYNNQQSFTQVLSRTWQLIPFTTYNSYISPSYTPNAYELVSKSFGFDTWFDVIEDADGNRYMTNGYYVIKDTEQPEPTPNQE